MTYRRDMSKPCYNCPDRSITPNCHDPGHCPSGAYKPATERVRPRNPAESEYVDYMKQKKYRKGR